MTFFAFFGDTLFSSKKSKFLAEIYPSAKPDEIKLMAQLNDKDDLKHMARELGWDEKRIKSEL